MHLRLSAIASFISVCVCTASWSQTSPILHDDGFRAKASSVVSVGSFNITTNSTQVLTSTLDGLYQYNGGSGPTFSLTPISLNSTLHKYGCLGSSKLGYILHGATHDPSEDREVCDTLVDSTKSHQPAQHKDYLRSVDGTTWTTQTIPFNGVDFKFSDLAISDTACVAVQTPAHSGAGSKVAMLSRDCKGGSEWSELQFSSASTWAVTSSGHTSLGLSTIFAFDHNGALRVLNTTQKTATWDDWGRPCGAAKSAVGVPRIIAIANGTYQGPNWSVIFLTVCKNQYKTTFIDTVLTVNKKTAQYPSTTISNVTVDKSETINSLCCTLTECGVTVIPPKGSTSRSHQLRLSNIRAGLQHWVTITASGSGYQLGAKLKLIPHFKITCTETEMFVIGDNGYFSKLTVDWSAPNAPHNAVLNTPQAKVHVQSVFEEPQGTHQQQQAPSSPSAPGVPVAPPPSPSAPPPPPPPPPTPAAKHFLNWNTIPSLFGDLIGVFPVNTVESHRVGNQTLPYKRQEFVAVTAQGDMYNQSVGATIWQHFKPLVMEGEISREVTRAITLYPRINYLLVNDTHIFQTENFRDFNISRALPKNSAGVISMAAQCGKGGPDKKSSVIALWRNDATRSYQLRSTTDLPVSLSSNWTTLQMPANFQPGPGSPSSSVITAGSTAGTPTPVIVDTHNNVLSIVATNTTFGLLFNKEIWITSNCLPIKDIDWHHPPEGEYDHVLNITAGASEKIYAVVEEVPAKIGRDPFTVDILELTPPNPKAKKDKQGKIEAKQRQLRAWDDDEDPVPYYINWVPEVNQYFIGFRDSTKTKFWLNVTSDWDDVFPVDIPEIAMQHEKTVNQQHPLPLAILILNHTTQYGPVVATFVDELPSDTYSVWKTSNFTQIMPPKKYIDKKKWLIVAIVTLAASLLNNVAWVMYEMYNKWKKKGGGKEIKYEDID